MEDDRSTSSSTMSSDDEQQDCDLPVNSPEVKLPLYPSNFSPLWFPYTPLRCSPMFNPNSSLLVPLAPPRSATPSIRHNFKSIDELISSSPTSLPLTSTPSHRNDDTGYSSQLLSASSLSSQASRASIDSADEDDEEEDEMENIKPSSSVKISNTKKNNETKKTKKLRTAFTDHQKMHLDRFYSTNRYPDPTQMENLSRLLSLDEKVIRVWFQNKRSREKNHPPPPPPPSKNDHRFVSTQNHLQTSSIHHPNTVAAMAMWHQFASSPNFLH